MTLTDMMSKIFPFVRVAVLLYIASFVLWGLLALAFILWVLWDLIKDVYDRHWRK